MITYTALICSWALGVYWSHTGTIQICNTVPVQEQRVALTHELGHKFWFERMTKEERKEWTDLRNSSLFTYLFWHTTPSVEEDFAYVVQELYEKKCTYEEMCDLTKRILKDHKK